MNKISRRQILQGIGAGVLVANTPTVFANQPKTIIVPFAPGGPIDTTARIITNAFPKIGVTDTYIVENKAGGNGSIGAAYVARAKPDGSTFLFGSIHHSIAPSLGMKLQYDILTDLVPVGFAATYPIILVVSSALPIKSVADLIALSKKQVLRFGSSGVGGGTHLAGELFNVLAGTNLKHIAYKGSAPAIQDLLGGHIDVMFADSPSASPHLNGGKIRPIAVGEPKRSPLFPNLPTFIEAGIKDYTAYSWGGVFAPKGTPANIVNQMNQHLNAALVHPEAKASLQKIAADAKPGTPADFGAFVKNEIAKWGKLIKDKNITV